MTYIPTFGATESVKDYRTLDHTLVGVPQDKAIGGLRYPAKYILNQRKVGICTAISLVQNAYVATGKRYSEDFQYLLQKHFIDKNWIEGSSPFSSLSAAKKYGLLPIEHLASIVTAQPDIQYPEYAKKLQAIANNKEELDRLLAVCEFPIKGYAAVTVSDDALLAKAIQDSKAGILVRFTVGSEWFSDIYGNITWDKTKLELLRPCKTVISGHQTSVTDYDYTGKHIARTANTWSELWCDDGSIRFDLATVRPTEGWIPYYDFKPEYVPLPDPHTWTHHFGFTMKLGDNTPSVKQLQVKLMLEGCMDRVKVSEWGIYGNKTRQGVFAFQQKRKIPLSLYERTVLRGSSVGPKTLAELNK